MTEQTKNAIKSIIESWIHENGNMPLRLLKSVLRSNNIPESLLENIQPKLWITNEFPEFTVVGTNGYEHIALFDGVYQILSEVISAEGRYLLSNIAPLLSAKGIEWRNYAKGKKLYEWIQDSYPGVFVLSEDKLWISMTGVAPLPSPSPSEPLVALDQETRSFVYQFCFFPANSALLRLLKELTGNDSLSQTRWASQRTYALAQALLGLNGGILDDSHAEKERLAFFTGLKTIHDQDIYGVLVRNTNEGASQKWIFSTVTYPGQDTDEGYWLCNTFGIKSQAMYGNSRAKTVSAISEALDALLKVQKAVTDTQENIQDLIDGGRSFPDKVVSLVMEYINRWNEIKKGIEKLDIDSIDNLNTTSSIRQFLDEMNDTNKVQEDLLQKYAELVRNTWAFMRDNMLCSEDHAEEDISSLRGILQRNISTESITQLHQLIEPFHSIMVLRSFNPVERGVLDDAEYNAIDIINEHFAARLKIAQLKHSIFNQEVDMSFLNVLSEIDALIQQLEYRNKKHEEEITLKSDTEFLSAALDGTLLGVAHKIFRTPNTLEEAIMLGDIETIHEIVDDKDILHSFGYSVAHEQTIIEASKNVQLSKTITPKHAAERLIQTVGNSSILVDRCLLLAVTQHEAGAVEMLIQHYIETSRLELAYTLFHRAEKALPDDLRQKFMLIFIRMGYISVDEAIAEDILAFLTGDGFQLINEVPIADELKERLIKIHEKIQPTLIHHIVFLSSELQSYILRPENASEIAEYCPNNRNKELSAILQENSYERGKAPLQVARRVYSFVGNWSELALDLAQFASENSDRQEFIFDLLREINDDVRTLKFIAEYPNLSDTHPSYYFDLLFRNNMYSDICEAARVREDLSTKQALQTIISYIKSGKTINSLPDFNGYEAVKEDYLLYEVGNALSYDQHLFKEYLMVVFPIAIQLLEEDGLRRLVTGDETLSKDDLCSLAQETSDSCPIIAIYCDHLLNCSLFEAKRESYLKTRYASLASLPSDEQKRVAHELRILSPDEYAELEDNIFNVQLSDLLKEGQDNKIIRLVNLLKQNKLSDESIFHVITSIGQDNVFCAEAIYETIYSLIRDERSTVEFLRISCNFWNVGDKEYKIFVCNRMLNAINRNLIPTEYLELFEGCILEMADSLDKRDLQTSILLIEKNRGREPYLSFVRNIVEQNNSVNDSEHSDLREEETNQEISLLCDALEADFETINDYFQFCSKLTITFESDNDTNTSHITTDVQKVLRKLYQNPTVAENWDAIEKMIPQSRIRARGIALYLYAHYLGNINSEDNWRVEKTSSQWTVGKANVAWERCVNYCISEDQDDLFFKSIRSWLGEINNYYVQQLPWYSTKHYMQTIQKILDDSDSIVNSAYNSLANFPSCPSEIALPLITEAIEVFKRIDQNKINQVNGDDNHNSLRVIIELGVRIDCEETLLEMLSEELSGSYVNLGLAFICRLLLTGKTSTAMVALQHMVNSSTRDYNYSSIVYSLASMSTQEELRQWLSVESNRATLRFMLPNGNAPDIVRLQTLVMNTFSDEAQLEDSINVIENILDCYPHDVMSYKSLFIICKENYSVYLPRIYRALVGIYKYYHSRPRNMYTRDRIHILTLIEILNQVMNQLGESEFQYESTTDLVRDYFHENDKKNPDDLVSMVNQISDEVKSLFLGIDKDSDAFSLIIKSLLGSVTGNWVPFFREAYHLRVSNWIRTYCVDKYKSSWGVLRGVLRVWQECPSDSERDEFLSWINKERELEKDTAISKFATKQLNNIVTKINFQAVNWSMLRLPWEEHLVCLGNLKDLDRVERNCCYKVMMAERLKGQPAKDSFVIMIRLAQDNLKAQLLYGNAKDWFRKGDYDLAGAAYEALAVTRITPAKDKYATKSEEFFETYETWMRISYVLAGVDITHRNCSQHSCMNMMCALIDAGYVRYFDRLHVFFTGINLKLFQLVRKVLATPLNEDDTIGMLSEFPRNQDRPALIAYLHFILSRDQTGRYLFLTNSVRIDSVTKELYSLEGAQNSYKQTKYWIPLRIRPLSSVFPSIEEQDTDNYSDTRLVSDHVAIHDENFRPRYFDEIEFFATNDDGRDLQNLLDEYRTLTPYSDSDCSKRLHISALICVRNLSNNGIESEKALVRFGINYYKYYYNRLRKKVDVDVSNERVHSAMLDLAIYGLQTPSANSEIILSMPNWLQHSVRAFTSVDQLLQDYTQNIGAYTSIIKLLSDTDYSDATNRLFEILNTLVMTINRTGTNSLEIRDYQAAQSQLSEINPTRDWVEMFSALNEMLRQAINKLDQRPSLKVTIFNTDSGLQNDGLYGEVENTGREPAYRLELQATFPNNNNHSVSSIYRLPSLGPNEKAVFAISYKASDSMPELEYILNITYSDREERISAEPLSGRLDIEQSEISEQSMLPQFNTAFASSFFVDDEGEIRSKDFKGRKSEIRRLTSLLEGDDFSNYHSAIVQGIKRSGKTSLLNYLRTFIRAKKGGNTVQLFVDCQAISKPFIYKAFFKSVLDELPLEYPQILTQPDWSDFVSRWKLAEGDGDRDPADISLFFRQLHQLMDGKGLYLLFDEFDVLIDRLDKDIGYDALLQALRSLQMNPDCLSSIHIVLCGSNHLLIYNQTGSIFNQMFQSYETIQVGQMLASDIHEMILDWLAQYPSIHFAKAVEGEISPSIQWIEHYTGGLVWYTRLLVNEAVRIVLKDKRNCVYPSDICSAFNSICNYINCRQLVEGCGEDDKIVLDAMQSLSDRPGLYVTYEQLKQRLEAHLNPEQIRKSLATLTKSVELLEQKSPNIQSFRFRIELYRRYFRTHVWLDNHESRFDQDLNPKNSGGGDSFTIVETDSNIETIDSNSEFDFV